jgi:predicted dehydrogenase
VVQALNVHKPDYVVLANQTSQHRPMLARLAQTHYRGRVLVEKPLFDARYPIPENKFRGIAVAYNLRFHPVIQRLREVLVGQQLLSVHAYVGQYLPDWRPGTDYRRFYSASAAEGGGALRDLSHELDYLGWLFGRWTTMTATGGHVSSLEIDTDDVFALLMQTDRCPVASVQVSYLDRVARRRILINTQRHAIEADLVGGTLAVDGKTESFAAERDFTYRQMHRAVLDGDMASLCTADEGLATLELIEAAERANRLKEWIRK